MTLSLSTTPRQLVTPRPRPGRFISRCSTRATGGTPRATLPGMNLLLTIQPVDQLHASEAAWSVNTENGSHYTVVAVDPENLREGWVTLSCGDEVNHSPTLHAALTDIREVELDMFAEDAS